MANTRDHVSQDDDLSFSMNASLIEMRQGGNETPSETGSMSSSSTSSSTSTTTLASNAASVRASTADLLEEASIKDPLRLSISSISSSSSVATPSSSASTRSPLPESMLQLGFDGTAPGTSTTSLNGDRDHADRGTESSIIESSQSPIEARSSDQDITPMVSMNVNDDDPFNTTLFPSATVAPDEYLPASASSALSSHPDHVPDSTRTSYPLAQALLHRHHRRQASAAMSDGDDTTSIASTNGSLNSEFEHLGGAHMLVMPSMRLSGPHSATTYGSSESTVSTYHSNEHDEGGRITSHALSSHDRHQATKLLILGKSVEHRATLARLLGMASLPIAHNTASHTPQRTDSQLDSMASSFWSIRTSEHGGAHTRSSTRQSHPWACDLDTLEALSHRSQFCEFSHPSSDDNMRELVENVARSITISLEGMEALINPTQARSEELVELVMRIGTSHFEACLVLFSSPPNSAEIALARIVAQVIPVFPILVLPPAPVPTKPLKTSALVEAVVAQLDSAGVRWTAALDHQIGGTVRGRATAKRGPSPLYLLPHELFTEKASQDLNAPASATHGTAPPSPTFTATSSNGSAPDGWSSSGSRSSSPATMTADLARLRTLVGTAGMRDRIRRANALAFLDWRDIEIAAVGDTKAVSPVSDDGVGQDAGSTLDTPSSETGAPPSRQDIKARRDSLEFSRRVAERRMHLTSTAKRGVTGTRLSPIWADLGVSSGVFAACGTSSNEDVTPCDPMSGSVSSLGSSSEGAAQALASTSVLEPDTPKCVSRSLPTFTSPTVGTLDPGHTASPQAAPSGHPANPARARASNGSSKTNAYVSDQLPSPFDPFHLPALLHLVGLNLRLSLIPWPMQAAQLSSEDVEKQSSSPARHHHSHGYPSSASLGVRSWMSTAVIVGAVFLAGFFCGIGVSTPLANARVLSLGMTGSIGSPATIRGACRSF
ncbi:BZ3500_MvSof-1268-A1-R1_Chr6-3g08882 [Microbotryum saponariae]|uniref:BZ3500_MvSof-1268-A1-R1_Chr6-3g08882 protein n=1 Tax=Microbotryum saponariae TaxID=289078 RepID=A0A2X0M607_9BASI|nr:BZ3500_MvSof-1268-A1-R1_Chr6-3g08882 [Microbotryum saponariae]SDA07483.1 BZ3501_MvSof-1269-A2-R1_Chr6-2g08585 [Microbotryum saponariae]